MTPRAGREQRRVRGGPEIARVYLPNLRIRLFALKVQDLVGSLRRGPSGQSSHV